jgi:hypothetical protein
VEVTWRKQPGEFLLFITIVEAEPHEGLEMTEERK